MATRYEMLVLESTTSTQDEVRERILSPPLLVVAASQTRGRGRSGAGWENAPRALAASLGVRPSWLPEAWPRITLIAGVAALRALGDRGGDLSLKWPNDLMRDTDKLGGILTEASGELVVVGWGANLHWPDPPGGRGSVFGEDPGGKAGPSIARRWADELLEMLETAPDDWPHNEYRRRCSTIGRVVTWTPDGKGRVLDVSHGGGLVVATTGGRVTLTSGAVSEVRRQGHP